MDKLHLSYLSILLLLLSSTRVLALRVDEKLPLRLLKVSRSKKTVLINRGIEDGLIKGDQARFYLMSGTVARGVVVKVSPSRSVWSLYRVIESDQLENNKVMNLKIIPKAKLTSDATKMLTYAEEQESGPSEQVVRDGPPEDLSVHRKILEEAENEDIEYIDQKGFFLHRPNEFWGMGYLSMLSSKNSTGSKGEGTEGEEKTIYAQVGYERYFMRRDSWYGRFSITPFLHYLRKRGSNVEGHQLGKQVVGVGAGVNWHFWAHPGMVGAVSFFLGVTGGMGLAFDEFLPKKLQHITGAPELNGRSGMLSFGIGAKYMGKSGLGARIFADYYFSKETFPAESKEGEALDDLVKTLSGPRALLGLFYRF